MSSDVRRGLSFSKSSLIRVMATSGGRPTVIRIRVHQICFMTGHPSVRGEGVVIVDEPFVGEGK